MIFFREKRKRDLYPRSNAGKSADEAQHGKMVGSYKSCCRRDSKGVEVGRFE
jgi:hypothetical protein